MCCSPKLIILEYSRQLGSVLFQCYVYAQLRVNVDDSLAVVMISCQMATGISVAWGKCGYMQQQC